MSFVAAKCTQCGANIEVDDSKDAGTCRNCGTAYVTQKAIHNYNISNNLNVNTTGNTINIYKAEVKNKKELSLNEVTQIKKDICEKEKLIEEIGSKNQRTQAIGFLYMFLAIIGLGIGIGLCVISLWFLILCGFGLFIVPSVFCATRAVQMTEKVNSLKTDVQYLKDEMREKNS